MAAIIKVRCNGAGKHVNEVDVEALTRQTAVYKMWGAPTPLRLRERYVLRCGQCADGDVVVTREMIEPHLPRG